MDEVADFPIPKRYHFRRLIDSGGMKEICLCVDQESGREVAIAFPRKRTAEAFRFFQEEAKLTARIEHPNIIPVHETGTAPDGTPYFVMKKASGRSLETILKKLHKRNPKYTQKYTFPVLLEIFFRICNAVEYAHSQGICHLDLKPGNIQVGSFGDVLVLDWGLARSFPEEDSGKEEGRAIPIKTSAIDRTLDGVIKGSPEYMAPEQALGLNSSRGPKCDIYSLGALLYSMIAFRPPVQGDSTEELIKNAAAGKLLPPRLSDTGGREIPQVLQFIAFKAMSLAPSKRYDSVLELEKDVHAYCSGYPTIAESPGFFTRFLLFLQRKKMQMFLGVCLFFLCFTLIVFLTAILYYKNVELESYQRLEHALNFPQ